MNFVSRIRAVCPDLDIETVQPAMAGRFNNILVVNNAIIFRFPRYSWVAANLQFEIALLRGLKEFVKLSIPEPMNDDQQMQPLDKAFLSYPMIRGMPLWRTVVEGLDPETLDVVIAQLAIFLNELHGVPHGAIPHNLQNLDSRDRWADIYEQVREHLFSYMRIDSRRAVAQHFESFLDNPRNFNFMPTLRHGDPGPGNILFDPPSRKISGLIDFDFAGLGDPAVDWSIILAPCLYGEMFVERFLCANRIDEETLARAAFYRGTWTVQEALRTFHAGEKKDFERVIAVYR